MERITDTARSTIPKNFSDDSRDWIDSTIPENFSDDSRKLTRSTTTPKLLRRFLAPWRFNDSEKLLRQIRRPTLNHLAQRMIHKLSRFPAPYRPNGSNGPQIRRTAPYIQGVCVPLADCGGCNVPGSVRGTLSSYIVELLIQLIHVRDCRGSNWFGRGSFCFLRLIQTEP